MTRMMTTLAITLALGTAPALAQPYQAPPSAAEQQGQQAIGLILGALAVGIIAHQITKDHGSDPAPAPVPVTPEPEDPTWEDLFDDELYPPAMVDSGIVPRDCLERSYDREGYASFGVDSRCLTAQTGFAAHRWCEIEPGLMDLDCMLDRGWRLERR